MCLPPVAAHSPVAPPGGRPARGKRWKPAGAVIPAGSSAPGRTDPAGADRGWGHAAPASHEPPTGSCVLGGAAFKLD